jgi:hypothetical protein
MLRDGGIAKLSTGLAHSRTLVYLNVSQNNLTPKGMACLFNSLLNSHSICSIHVGNEGSTNRNRIGSLGTKSLSNLLEHNKLISFLDIRNLNMGLECIQILSEGISKSNSIVYINLSRNEVTLEAS